MSHEQSARRTIPPADEPAFNVGANASWPGLVYLTIGTGRDVVNITPERAAELAAELLDAAAAARASG